MKGILQNAVHMNISNMSFTFYMIGLQGQYQEFICNVISYNQRFTKITDKMVICRTDTSYPRNETFVKKQPVRCIGQNLIR